MKDNLAKILLNEVVNIADYIANPPYSYRIIKFNLSISSAIGSFFIYIPT